MSDEGKRQSTDESVKTVEDEMGDLLEADIKVILLGDSAVGKSSSGTVFAQITTHGNSRMRSLFRYADEVDGKQVKVDFGIRLGKNVSITCTILLLWRTCLYFGL